MKKMKKVSDKEILEDMTDMLQHTADFKRTTSMIKMSEDELLIFKRAAHQLKKPEPNMLILRKAYDIFIAKSYSNNSTNHYDTQTILGENNTRRGFFSGLFDSTALNLILAVILLLTILNFLK